MNIVMLIGRLSSSVDVRKVGDTECATFRVKVEDKFQAKDGTQKIFKQFITIKAWSSAYKNMLAQKCGEGDMLSVQGAFKTDSYEKNGARVYSSYVNADKIVNLHVMTSHKLDKPLPKQVSEDDIPF